MYILYERRLDKNEALKCYDKIIKINPKYVKTWIKKGLIHEWTKGLKRIRCIEINPKYEKVYNFRQINPKYVSRAYIKYYDKAIEINNSNYENNAVDIWLYLCYTLAYRISVAPGTDSYISSLLYYY